MTALTTRDTLAKALCKHGHVNAHVEPADRPCPAHDKLANNLLASGAVIDADSLFADLRAEVRSGAPTAPLVTAAQEGIERRLRWQSLHWGTESVHPDAWPHIAAAACEGVEKHVRAALTERVNL